MKDLFLLPSPLRFLIKYPRLHKVAHKGFAGIFESLFEELADDDTDIDVISVTGFCSTISLSYAQVFTEQVTVKEQLTIVLIATALIS